MEAKYVERRKIVARLLEERPACEACKSLAGYREERVYTLRQSGDIHEIINRSQGGDILEESNLLAVCRTCHTWITSHPHEAQHVGLHLPSWADDDMFAEAAVLREKWARGEEAWASWLE